MAIHCAVCGEELLGAVNRCWRCGAKMELPAGDPDLPPVRQVALPMALDAERPAPADEIFVATIADGSAAGGQRVPPQAKRRVGSPFAADFLPVASVAAGPTEVGASPAPREPNYPTRTAARGGALAALVLGALSLVCSFFSIGALFLSVVGILVGIWGLNSEHRGRAIVGMLLCCLGLAISGFQAVVLLYELRYGVKPWDLPAY